MTMTPILEGPVRTNGFVSARIVSFDIGAEEQVEFTDSTGVAHQLSLNDFSVMSDSAFQVVRQRAVFDEARLRQYHPMLSADSAQLLHAPTQSPSSEQLVKVLYPVRNPEFSQPFALYPHVGVPCMRWQAQGQTSYWQFGILGEGVPPRFTNLGESVQWDDAEGIARMVESLQDPNIALDALSARHLTLSLNVRAALAAPHLAALGKDAEMSLPIARKVLTSARLCAPRAGTVERECGRVRVLSLDLAMGKVPVAVCVQAPLSPRRITNAPYGNAAVEWRARAEAAYLAAGWHIVSVPHPERDRRESFWVTRIAPEVWRKVRRAVSPVSDAGCFSRGGFFA